MIRRGSIRVDPDVYTKREMDGLTSFAHAGYRGRLAPSPTGYLHIGHARTFATAWRRAREAGGALVMRMEDLDRDRSRMEYAAAALEDLRWLGLDWDEGPDVGGAFGPYAQSERGEVYLDAWKRLRESGLIYPCRCSRKDLAAAVSAPHEGAGRGQDAEDEPVYPGTCRPSCTGKGVFEISSEMADGPSGMNWRFRVPDGEPVEFEDLNLGTQRYVAGVDFGDFLLWRRDGVPGSPWTGPRPWGGGVPGSPRTGPRPWGGGCPSYQLACVADDAAMRITEVVRGADLLKSTARQILLNRALGFADPKWFHCELSVDDQGRRLAKRHDALSIRSLRERGFRPEAILEVAR
ncbi:MAG: glutamate--tRNA ligase family protein [Terracidiphilus sp.]